jgi:hypothetical protein
MTDRPRSVARQLAGRARGEARQLLAKRGQRLRDEHHRQDLLAKHVTYLEARLHTAEDTVAKLDRYGLVQALSENPESFARWLTWRPPGHFYSTVPNLDEIQRQADTLWPAVPTPELIGIDLAEQEQLALFDKVAELASTLPVHHEKTEPWRYYSDNPSYCGADALMLNGMLRVIQPNRLIEIGSGFSSAMTLDTVEHFLGSKTEITFIEPYPELLESLLRPSDRDNVSIVAKPLQDVGLELFSTLEDGDVLFIDSTHVLKTGSDVVWLYNKLLPTLKVGVWVHIHDMFHSFEYPQNWVMEGRAWGEVYLVRAFLSHNSDFEIKLFTDWLSHFHKDRIATQLPAMLPDVGGSLWLRRARDTSTPLRPTTAG